MPVATDAPTCSGSAPDVDARVLLGLARRGEHELHEAVHAPRRLAVDPVRRIEVLQLAGEVHRVAARVEERDPAGARLARDERAPRRLDVVAERAHHPHPGDDDPLAGRFRLASPTSPVRRRRAALRP